MINTSSEVINYLCEKLKVTTSPNEVKRLCNIIKTIKYAEYKVTTEDCLDKIKRLCIDGYFNTKYIIEKYSIGLNNLVGQKKKEFEEFLKDLKSLEYDREHGTNA